MEEDNGADDVLREATSRVLQHGDDSWRIVRTQEHHQPNEQQPGPNNSALDAENPSSVWSPDRQRAFMISGSARITAVDVTAGLRERCLGGWSLIITERPQRS
jgi:hypothetical protein